LGSLLCRLKKYKFVGNFVLFERREFTKFPLSKFIFFSGNKAKQGRLSFGYFSLAKQRKVTID